jgi:hypothetical protein
MRGRGLGALWIAEGRREVLSESGVSADIPAGQQPVSSHERSGRQGFALTLMGHRRLPDDFPCGVRCASREGVSTYGALFGSLPRPMRCDAGTKAGSDGRSAPVSCRPSCRNDAATSALEHEQLKELGGVVRPQHVPGLACPMAFVRWVHGP